jgi:ABC-2 type transport system ATP-binding protein
MPNSIISVKNLTVRHKKRLVLDNVSFYVPKNKICAFIGANGSGKTSTIKSILNINKQFQGKILINKVCSKNLKSHDLVAYCPEEHIHDSVKGITFLRRMAMLNGIDKIHFSKMLNSLLKFFKIDNNLLNSSFKKMSHGEKQLILIINTLLEDKPINIMDEPTSNLDPKIRFMFFEYLKKHRNSTYFISSHNIYEARQKTN